MDDQNPEQEVKNLFIQNILPNGKITVFADHRENSMVPSYIKECGAEVVLKQLKVADYICSDRVAIEKKSSSDFLQSIINQRIFKQMEEIAASFDRPLLILEGNPDMLFFERKIHPNTIRGVLSSIAIDYKVPIIWTSNPKETAGMIYWIAKREQDHEKRSIQIRAKTKKESLTDQQEYMIAGLPNISNVLSKRLLEKFKTVKKVFSAKESQLKKVDGIGEEKAKKIWEILNKEYEDANEDDKK